MKWAILSDVHGNLEALGAVLKDLAQEGVDRIVFLGDAVGYGANPNECLQMLRERAHRWVAGNHDCGAIGRTDISYFNTAAYRAIQWTGRKLLQEHRAFLLKLPLTCLEGEVLLVHASPFEPAQWHYVMTSAEAARGFKAMTGHLAFIGHSHCPMVLTQDDRGRIQSLRTEELALDPDRRYMINVGSVGQPRDGNPHAAYGLWDDLRRKYRLRRLPYDVAEAQRKIVKENLPIFLAYRLSRGV